MMISPHPYQDAYAGASASLTENQEEAIPTTFSTLFYQDAEIDPKLANTLTVYKYRLPAAEYRSPKELPQMPDAEEMRGAYAFYRVNNSLFVALENAQDPAPILVDRANSPLPYEKVAYHPSLNYVWLRLILRQLNHPGSPFEARNLLGQYLYLISPLTQSLQRKQKLYAMEIDCRLRQESSGTRTEVQLNFKNVVLFPLSAERIEQIAHHKKHGQSYWTYAGNQTLRRWYPKGKKAPKGAIYQALTHKRYRQGAGLRIQYPFLNLRNADTLKESRAYIVKEVQNRFITLAARYGFFLTPKQIPFRKLPHKTRASTKESFPFTSIPQAGEITLIDLRKNSRVPTHYFETLFNTMLNDLGLSALTLRHNPAITPETIANFTPKAEERALVIIDQVKGMEDDHYRLTDHLAPQISIQHINVNPYEYGTQTAIENGLVEVIELDEALQKIHQQDSLLRPTSAYFEYEKPALLEKHYLSELKMRFQVSLKEIRIKELILKKAPTSEILPELSEVLTEDLLMITERLLCTFEKGYPRFIPLKEQEKVEQYLYRFNCSLSTLFTLLKSDRWPYQHKYITEEIQKDPKKLASRLNQLTFLITRTPSPRAPSGWQINIAVKHLQSPLLLPQGIERVPTTLKRQFKARPLAFWAMTPQDLAQLKAIIQREKRLTVTEELPLFPELEEPHSPREPTPLKGVEEGAESLLAESPLTESQCNKLLTFLSRWVTFWNKTLQGLAKDGHSTIHFADLRSRVFRQWHSAELKTPGVRDSHFNNALTLLFSEFYGIDFREIRHWWRQSPGNAGLWHGRMISNQQANDYFIISGLRAPELKLERQPSIRRWTSLQGDLDIELMRQLLDVDWVRLNQLAGNTAIELLARRWKEIYLSK